jgi:hypothetical protein
MFLPPPAEWMLIKHLDDKRVEVVSFPYKCATFTFDERDLWKKIYLPGDRSPLDGKSRSLDPDIRLATPAINAAKKYGWPITPHPSEDVASGDDGVPSENDNAAGDDSKSSDSEDMEAPEVVNHFIMVVQGSQLLCFAKDGSPFMGSSPTIDAIDAAVFGFRVNPSAQVCCEEKSQSLPGDPPRLVDTYPPHPDS